MIDVPGVLVLGPGADQQHADRQGGRFAGLMTPLRQAAADTDRLRALEQVAAAVVEQLPGKREPLAGGFAGRHLLSLGGTDGQVAIDLD